MTKSGLTIAFSCRILVDLGQFTVPAYILLGVPPGSGSAVMQQQVYVPFAVTGIDEPGLGTVIEYTGPAIYQ